MTHRPNAITHTREYRVLPGVLRHTFIFFSVFIRSQTCAPLTQNSGDATEETVAAARHPSVYTLGSQNNIRQSPWLQRQDFSRPSSQLSCRWLFSSQLDAYVDWCRRFTSENLCLTRHRQLFATCAGLWQLRCSSKKSVWSRLLNDILYM